MLRRPLLSTLFPYTTLFRSLLLVEVPHHHAAQPLNLIRLEGLNAAGVALREIGELEIGDHIARIQVLQRVRAEDRKSTRLNSSHSSISYAVFCLKKKKTNNT